jgi:energy-converting hydrogenase Eha subunit A
MARFALLATLILRLAPRAVQRVQMAVTTQFWKSALVGLLAQLLGLTGAASGLARLIQNRSSWTTSASFSLPAVGLALIWGITLLGRLVSLGGGPLAAIGAVVVLTGFIIEYAAWTVGLGGALLTRFSRRGPLTAVAAPPVPDLSSDPFAGGSAAL